MGKPSRYWLWLLVGPQCPAAQPLLGGPVGEPTLPAVLSSLAESSVSHWWLHANAETRRHVIYLVRQEGSAAGKANIDDLGSELNLRSHNASTSDQQLHAYLLQGDASTLPQWCLSGRFAEFHLHAERAESLKVPFQFLTDYQLAKALANRIYSFTRMDLPTRTIRFVLKSSDDAGTGKTAANSYVLLPGVVLLQADRQELSAVLDAFLISNDPQALVASTECDPRDFLLTVPHCEVPKADSFFGEQWGGLSDALFHSLLTTQPDVADWPPLLRLCLAARQVGVRDFLLERVSLTVDPLESEVRGLRLEGDWQQPIQAFRKWMLRDAVLDAVTPSSWKQNVVQHQRDQFFSSLAESGGWYRLWFITPSTAATRRGQELSAPDPGYCGRLEKPPAGLLDGEGGKLPAWLAWLRTMGQGERRGDFEDILAFVEYVSGLAEAGGVTPSALAPLCKLLASCLIPADDVRLVFFNHDQFLDEIGHRLFEPAFLQLQHVPFADRQPLVRRCLYFLLAFVVSPRRVPRDKSEDGAMASEPSDWLRDSVVLRHLSLAIGIPLEPIGKSQTASFRLPHDASAAALTRLLVPPGRLRSRGFILGKSRLNHPVEVFG